MARRPRSHSKHELRDVSEFEEKRLMTKTALALLVQHLYRKIAEATRDDALLREDRIWIEIRDAFAVLFLLLTALRRFEFCASTCGDVDLENAKLWATGKGNLRNFVPLPEQAITLIKEWLALKATRGESLAKDAPLFCATGPQGGFLSFSALRLRWKKLLREIGLPKHFGLHSTRHAAGMLVFAQTESIEKTARFLRHRDTATTARHYLHVDVDELRKELSSIELWRKE
jgi:integrase/recombinase XerC